MNQATQTPDLIPLTHPCWEHIDLICPIGEGDILTAIINAMEKIKTALLSPEKLERQNLVRVCDHAIIDARAAWLHLNDAITVMSGVSLDDE